MDLRDLHYFEVIADLQHVGEAARVLHKSQPTLTSCLRRLEKQVGCALVERAGRGIRLTAAGQALRDFSVKTRLSIRDAEVALRSAAAGLSGEVKLGLVPSAAQFLLPEIVRAVFQDMPDVLLKTEVATFAMLDPRLHAGEFDFIVVGDSHPADGVVSLPLAPDEIVPAAAPDHPVFQLAKPKLADLALYRWILQPRTFPHRQWIEDAFRQAGLPPPHVQVETNMLNLQPQLVASSGLLTVLPKLQLGADAPLRQINVPGCVLCRRLVICYRRDAYVSPAARRLMNVLVRAAPVGSAASSVS
ncbi:LysR family transcriptional regulator [Hydrogenophaga sp.]|jgi:DNA-binding transcriptional LysR family regulator|uniref:LysR family transcriptional regulator n=1 Tax=Hydrogenophaga sp. TaxID=1904254 RepID=UPI003F725727